jgi:hypothetical protein
VRFSGGSASRSAARRDVGATSTSPRRGVGGRWPRLLILAAALLTHPAAAAEGSASAGAPLATSPMSAATGVAPTPGPQLIQTVTTTLRVRDVDAALANIAARAASAQWRIEERSEGELVLRVPPADLEAARHALGELGLVIDHRGRTEDVTARLADLTAARQSAARRHERLLALQDPQRSVDEALALSDALAETEDELASLDRERAELLGDVAEARLVVRCLAVGPPAEPIPAVELPFRWLQWTNEDALRAPARSPARRGTVESMLDVGMHLELSRLTNRPEPGRDPVAVGGAVRSRMFPEMKPLGIALGFDLAMGGGAGFSHEVDFLVGVSGALSPWLSCGVLTGASGRAWTGGRIPAAWELPAEVVSAFELADWGRLLVQIRPQWIPRRDHPRQVEGAFGGVDETLVRVTLAAAPLAGKDHLEDGALRLGVAYQDLLGESLATVFVGWGIGAVDRRHRY